MGVATADIVKKSVKLRCQHNLHGGYGVGEYSALCTAHVLNFPDGLYILSKFSLFYEAMREAA